MATQQKRFIAKHGLDANNLTIANVAAPLVDSDAATKGFAKDASNLTTGTLPAARLPASGATAGTYNSATEIHSFDVDAYGRITSVSAAITIAPAWSSISGVTATATEVNYLSGVTTAIQTQLAARVLKSGGTMTGSLAFGGAYTATGLVSPTDVADAATKGYVDSLLGGLSWQAPVGGIGATNPGTCATGDRFINTTDDKVYTATGTNTWGAGVTPADGWAAFDTTDETGYVFSGTDWVAFTGTGQITAGVGLEKVGNVLNINLGAGIQQLPTDEVGIDVWTGAGASLILTLDGTSSSSLTTAQLNLKPTTVTAGTYIGFDVDAYGRITGVTLPTTLSGYGITDAQPLGNELTALQALADTAGFVKKTGDGAYSIDTSTYLVGTAITGAVVNNSQTQTQSFTVNNDGLITAIGVAQTITPAWSSITSKPASDAEFGYLVGVTSAIQTQLDSKVGIVHGAIGSATLTTTATTADQVIESISATTFRSVEYVISVYNSTLGDSLTTKLLVTHDGVDAYLTEYGSVDTGTVLATFTADINAGNLRLLTTPAQASSTVFKVVRTAVND